MSEEMIYKYAVWVFMGVMVVLILEFIALAIYKSIPNFVKPYLSFVLTISILLAAYLTVDYIG